MHFVTDRQTVDDLNIFGHGGGTNSIYGIFNHTRTRGGAALMEQVFNEPLSDAEKITRRIGIIRFFMGRTFPFSAEWFDQLEQYLANTDERTKLVGSDRDWGSRVSGMVAVGAEEVVIQKGIAAAVALAHACRGFIKTLETGPYASEAEALRQLLSEPVFEPVWKYTPGKKLRRDEGAELDDLFRFRHRAVVRKLLDRVYYLDVYIAVAAIARDRGFAFPTALAEGPLSVEVKGLYHPGLSKPVANTIHITPENNVVFLTGANMAGKSTFMKSLGIAVYLAHLGFPVPAEEMTFSVLDGLYTTINLGDNLAVGASHFYAEVLRVKKVAEALNSGRKFLVIFDELFRGTNVRDAYEGTLAITEAFASKRNSIFVISTHIIEAGPVLRERCHNISFLYLPTEMRGTQPVYTYQLSSGITDDRHGMVIIRNEGVLELLEKQGTSVKSPFLTDNQTLNDLNLLGKYRRGSIYSLFCTVRTQAGERLLDGMFRHPLDDVGEINRRSILFRHFGSMSLTFTLSGEAFESLESYLDDVGPSNLLMSVARTIRRWAAASIVKDEAHRLSGARLRAAVAALKEAHAFLIALMGQDPAGPYSTRTREALAVLENGPLRRLLKEDNWGLLETARCDYLLRTVYRSRLEEVRRVLAELDVFIAVGNQGRANGWTYAIAVPAEEGLVNIAGLRHPALPGAVKNTVVLNTRTNTLFLTGANMAGKSTLMKSFGVAVYLAHMGFPVAADGMSFSIRDGLFSSINVADDLDQGYSHFYAEVLRVKTVAEAVGQGKRLVVLFDELFKGTNVKDAYDGTLSVVEAFAMHRQCAFVVSTHIVEVGEALGKRRDNVRFEYLPTVMEGTVPRYTYRLEPGISADRHGMLIIENEHIIELINNEKP